MSATGGASYPYSTYNSGDSWRASESVYDRPHHLPSHRRSSSPRRYMAYDRYVPSRSSPRSGPVWSNNYRPDSPPTSGRYHGDTPNLARSPSPWNSSKLTPNPYRRSPSPERHFTSHVPGVDPRDSSTAWLETSKQERQPSSPAPSLSRDRGRRGSILATRMFEPSDSWKQNHSDRRDDTTRALSLERSPILHGDSYRPGLPHKDRSVVGRTGYDSYIPAYPSSSPDSRRKSSPRPRVRNIWPTSRSRSRSVSLSPRESRRSSAYQRRRSSRSRTPSHRGRSSSHRRTYSRSRRSTSRGLRSLSRGRRSISRRRRSRHRYSYSRSSSRDRRSSSRTRCSRGHSSSRGRSMSRTRSLRNGNSAAGHFRGLSGTNGRTRSRSRSSIASSIASSRASDRLPTQNVNLPVSKDINGSGDIKQKAQVTADIHSPPRTASISDKLLDTKTFESSQPPPSSTASDQSKKMEPESVVVTDAHVLQPPLPSPRSPITVQHAEPSDDQSSPTTSHPNGIMEHDSFETADIPPPASISPNTASKPSLPVPLVTHSPSINHRNASPPVTEHQRPLASKKVVKPVMPSNNVSALLPTPQPTPDPSPQIRLEIKPPKLEDIPKLSEAKSTAEALRTVVMTRLVCDRQSREDRVNPVLATNLQLVTQSRDPRPSTSAVSVFEDIIEGRKEDRVEQFNSLRGSLIETFRHRQTVISEKIQRLRKEYISLHERWVAHCASLDDQAKPAVTTESETVPVTRSTRRSTTMSDAVRSDLEMEQIIASLGYDEATDPNQLSLRNLATVPDMISVTNGKVDYVFDDTNHLVDNPSEYYGPTTGIHDWTDAEKQIFLNKFAAYPKQFGVIAEHIPNKTAAQCVDYYYLHKKKVIDFRKVVSQYAPGKRKRRGAGRKKGNGLLADIRQHDAEVHGKSEAPPPPQPSGRTGRKRMTRPTPKEPKKPTVSRRTTILQTEDTSTATPTPEPESRPRRRRVQSAVSTTNATPTITPAPLMMPVPLDTSALAASIPSLAHTSASLSRTISIAVEDVDDDPLDVERPAKRSRRSRKVKSAAIINEELSDLVQEIKSFDQSESTTRRKVTSLPVQWSEADKNLFLRLLGQYGDDFKRIAASMPNKTTVQVSNYYRTNLVDLDLEKVAAGAPKRSPTPQSSQDSPQTAALDSTPVMSSLTRDTSQATVKHAPREVPISSTIRSNLSYISKQPELASATTSPYTHLAYPVTNGRLGYTPSAIPPAPYPTIPYTYSSYNDSHYSHFTSRTGQRPIAPHPDLDHTRRGTTVPPVPLIHKEETSYPILQASSVPPTSTPHSLES